MVLLATWYCWSPLPAQVPMSGPPHPACPSAAAGESPGGTMAGNTTPFGQGGRRAQQGPDPRVGQFRGGWRVRGGRAGGWVGAGREGGVLTSCCYSSLLLKCAGIVGALLQGQCLQRDADAGARAWRSAAVGGINQLINQSGCRSRRMPRWTSPPLPSDCCSLHCQRPPHFLPFSPPTLQR